jgi:uncharacterized membrane protein YgdD (TMEM256/DUF423 family)
MDRLFIALAGLYGTTAVALGAFGAHGLRNAIGSGSDLDDRLRWWETAAQYHLAHALAIGLCAWLVSRGPGWPARVAGFAFVIGAAIFSGTLYAMALGAPRVLGAITPLGGLAMIVGWCAVVGAAVLKPR